MISKPHCQIAGRSISLDFLFFLLLQIFLAKINPSTMESDCQSLHFHVHTRQSKRWYVSTQVTRARSGCFFWRLSAAFANFKKTSWQIRTGAVHETRVFPALYLGVYFHFEGENAIKRATGEFCFVHWKSSATECEKGLVSVQYLPNWWLKKDVNCLEWYDEVEH